MVNPQRRFYINRITFNDYRKEQYYSEQSRAQVSGNQSLKSKWKTQKIQSNILMKVREVHKRTAQSNELCEYNGEIIENADWVCIINVEKKRDTGQYYLTFKRVKIRYKDLSDMGYFNHPFEGENRMRLIDDLYLDKSLSEDSLVSDFGGVDLLNKNGKRQATERDDDSSSDLFDFSKSISK